MFIKNGHYIRAPTKKFWALQEPLRPKDVKLKLHGLVLSLRDRGNVGQSWIKHIKYYQIYFPLLSLSPQPPGSPSNHLFLLDYRRIVVRTGRLRNILRIDSVGG